MSNCPRVEWITKPGLWDPYVVTRVAVQVLMRDVYPILERKLSRGTTISGKGLCPGLKLYLEPKEFDTEVEKKVDEYIKFPCQTKLQEIVCVSSKNALQFLLTFFRRRGPIVRIPMVSADMAIAQSVSNSIHYVDQHLQRYPELDSCAFTILGRYLTHVIRVAFGHEIHIMHELLAKVWGPILIHVDDNTDYKKYQTPALTVEDRILYAVKVFKMLLKSFPWERHRPVEDMCRTIHHTPHFYKSQRHLEQADYITAKKTIPESLNNSLCVSSLKETLKGKHCPGDSEKPLSSEEKRDLIEANAMNLYDNFPPDNKCSIDYSFNRSAEQFQ